MSFQLRTQKHLATRPGEDNRKKKATLLLCNRHRQPRPPENEGGICNIYSNWGSDQKNHRRGGYTTILFGSVGWSNYSQMKTVAEETLIYRRMLIIPSTDRVSEKNIFKLKAKGGYNEEKKGFFGTRKNIEFRQR